MFAVLGWRLRRRHPDSPRSRGRRRWFGQPSIAERHRATGKSATRVGTRMSAVEVTGATVVLPLVRFYERPVPLAPYGRHSTALAELVEEVGYPLFDFVTDLPYLVEIFPIWVFERPIANIDLATDLADFKR